MKKIILSILALASVMMSAQAEDKVLMTIDGQPVKQSEFLYIYNKNNQETTIDQKSIDEYLDLFINFKLKVREAEKQGIDTTAAFKKELASYRKQAIPKYLEDSTAEEQMMRLSYDHMKMDRRVAHIAVECPMGADDSTVQAALAKINDARLRVTTGKPVTVVKKNKRGKKVKTTTCPPENFYDVAMEVSTDPSKEENKGELGWVAPFRYVWPLEKAVYNTPVGGVSDVFRTQYGFHIALVEEERPHTEVKASHIMKMTPRGCSDSVAAAAKQTIENIWHIAKDSMANFADLARQFSDDKGTARNGGSLGWFGKGLMVKPFEDQAFSLKPGELSEPFQSRFGWHIILLDSVRDIQPYEAIRSEIRQKVRRDERQKEVQQAHIANLKAEYNLPDTMSDKAVLAYEDANLENKYPELKNLVKEYHDGILLFDVSLKEVWDKASLDTAGLTKYFKEHKKAYTFDQPRYKGRVVYCKDKNTVRAAKAILRAADKDSVDSYFDHRINVDSTVYVHSDRGLWTKGQKPAVDKLAWKSGDFQPSEDYPFVFLDGKIIKAPEEYTDVRGKVTSDYQDYLEKEWVAELRKKYEVKINQEALDELKAAEKK